MRRIKRHMILICTIPGIFIFFAISLYFLYDDRPHGALNTVSEPVGKAAQVSSAQGEALAPELPWDDRPTVDPESLLGMDPAKSSTPPSAAAPDSTSPEEQTAQLMAATIHKIAASYKVRRMSGDAPDPEFMRVDTWAKQDPVFQACVEERSNVWLCMPLDATERQVDAFKAAIRPTIVERNERLEKLLKSVESTDSPEYAAGWWDIRHWARDRYMEAFMLVWPDCNANDPMPSVLRRSR